MTHKCYRFCQKIIYYKGLCRDSFQFAKILNINKFRAKKLLELTE